MKRRGVVSAVGQDNRYQVKLAPAVGCGNCAAAGGCGVQMLPTNLSSKPIDCIVTSDDALALGQCVSVQLSDPDTGWLRMVCFAYGIPTLGMIIGAIAGYWAAIALQIPQLSDVTSMVGFFAGLAGGLIAWTTVDTSTEGEFSHHNNVDTGTIVGVVESSRERL